MFAQLVEEVRVVVEKVRRSERGLRGEKKSLRRWQTKDYRKANPRYRHEPPSPATAAVRKKKEDIRQRKVKEKRAAWRASPAGQSHQKLMDKQKRAKALDHSMDMPTGPHAPDMRAYRTGPGGKTQVSAYPGAKFK